MIVYKIVGRIHTEFLPSLIGISSDASSLAKKDSILWRQLYYVVSVKYSRHAHVTKITADMFICFIHTNTVTAISQLVNMRQIMRHAITLSA